MFVCVFTASALAEFPSPTTPQESKSKEVHLVLCIRIFMRNFAPYFFTYFNPDLAPVNKRIIETYKTEGEQATWDLLTDWYTNGHPKEHPFANPPSQEITAETAKEIVDELLRHDRWTAKAGISVTPTILIDGKPLPAGYTVEDLIYLYT